MHCVAQADLQFQIFVCEPRGWGGRRGHTCFRSEWWAHELSPATVPQQSPQPPSASDDPQVWTGGSPSPQLEGHPRATQLEVSLGYVSLFDSKAELSVNESEPGVWRGTGLRLALRTSSSPCLSPGGGTRILGGEANGWGPSDLASDWPEWSSAASDWSRWQLPPTSPTSSLFLVLPSLAQGLTAWTLGVTASEPPLAKAGPNPPCG